MKVRKSYTSGWTAESREIVNGQTWLLITMKSSNSFIYTTAQKIQVMQDDSISYSCSDARVTLIRTKGRATEAMIKRTHAEALAIFDSSEEIAKHSAEKPYEIECGQILINDFVNYETEKTVIYRIENTRFGKTYHTIGLESLALGTTQRPKDYAKKFGIGTYYVKGEMFEGDLCDLVIEAKELAAKKELDAQVEKELAKAAREAKIEIGKELVTIPADAKCIIVADDYSNDSDGMTDYFSTSVNEMVVLAYSKSTRQNMKELKKAAKKFSKTAQYADGEEFENRDGHNSYTPAMYVGEDSWSGWKVNKRKYWDLTKQENIEELYIAAAEGRYLVDGESTPTQSEETVEAVQEPITEQVSPEAVENQIEAVSAAISPIEVEVEQAKEEKPAEAPKNTYGVGLVDYSEKAFAVIGQTKAIKEELGKLGGRFNARLKCGAGWIFSKKHLDKVCQFLGIDSKEAF